MKHILIILFWMMAALSAFARLGETEAQLIDRLGKVVSTFDHSIYAQGKIFKVGTTLHFKKDDWTVVCVMISNKCAQVQYSKSGEWTEDQIKMLLSNNSSDYGWQEVVGKQPNKLLRNWKRTGGGLAEYKFTTGLTITAAEYLIEKKRIETEALKNAHKLPRL